ncbi:MAG: hypothetical protein IAI50_00880, partial [Candidatus Eremiobacteraeota bacterium]|nr:hypothetical protein [Candidatus Eremiobacteraeota bacterium]
MNTQTNDQVGDERHTIATYLGDMIALERHIAAPIEAQLASPDHNKYADAIRIITKIKTITTNHIASLQAQLEAVGNDPASGIKSA